MTGTDDQDHRWENLGYQHSWDFRSSQMTDSGGKRNDTVEDECRGKNNNGEVEFTGDSLADIPAVGDTRESELRQAGYTTVRSVAEATVEELVTTKTINKSDAYCILEAARELCGEDGTIQHQIADECNVPRQEVSEAFARIAYRKGSFATKRAALREVFCDEPRQSILHLESHSLNFLYLLYQAGFETAEDVATALLDELTEVGYIDKDRAKKIRASAREVVSGEFSDRQQDSMKTDSNRGTDPNSEFICEKCGKRFKFKSVLRKHGYSCDQSVDSHSSELSEKQNSMKTDSNRGTDPNSKFICEKCGKRFKFKSVLRKHGYSCDQSVDSHSSELSENADRTPTPSSMGWDIDSLAAATTLDTDEIEDAVNRVITSGCSHDEAIGYVRRYLKEMLQGEGLFAVYGVGPSRGSSLVKAGVTTTDELQAVTPYDLSNRTDLSTAQVQRLQEAAQAGNFASLEPDDEQVAEQLIDSSVESLTQNTDNKQPSNTERQPARGATQLEESDSGLSGKSESSSIDTPPQDDDSKQEALVPGELPVPVPEEYTVPGGGTVYPNYLSEYYESFRNARKVLELVFQIPGTDIDPEDRRDPRVQYFILLDACIGFGDASTLFTGYGPQHQDRLSFSIRDYRKVFGDAETVTHYQVINVRPFREDTHELLQKRASVKTTREFVRPCVPGTNYSIPELPGSLAELQDALLQLATFPAYPPLPSENGTNNRTIPVADMYRTCFGDL
ncbi:helix-hairpin-helix domain-containing protein, partial [Halalkalirubrum salinum]|uniref:helix-hairpin-helix domain-containing protein n=1 Tax=Halalkalirubrum salinum TaxID=2563889 RepID=UPI00197A70EF